MNISNKNDGIMYFAHRMQEATFHYTIDIYKSSLYNTNQLAREYISVSNSVNLGDLNSSYLEEIRDEFLDSIVHDIILKNYFGEDNIRQIKQLIGSSNLKSIEKIMHYLANTWDNCKYFNWCKDYIRIVTKQKTEKKKIEQAIRCFIPELYAYGYSNEFIYKSIRSVFFDKKINNNSIEKFLNIFDTQKHEYDVYIAIDKKILDFEDILKNNLNIKFDDDGYFNKFQYDVDKFVLIKVSKTKARDPNSALENAKNLLNIFTLFYIAIDNKSEFETNNVAMIRQDKDNQIIFINDEEHVFKKIEKYSDKEAGLVAEDTLNKLLELFNYNRQTLISLISIFEKHNSAINDDNIENSFLNLWSILEMATKNIDSGTKIEKIRSTTLTILSNNYFKRVIFDLDKNIKGIIGNKKYNEILSKTNIKDKNNDYILACIIFMDEFKEIREEIFAQLKNNSNIRSRISQLNEMGGNCKNIYSAINKYRIRVGWHLTRMYRCRNCIVHSGLVDDNIKHICNHLHSYIDVLMLEFINRFTHDLNLRSIDDVIIYNKLYNDKMEKYLNKDIKINAEIISFILD